MILCKHTEHGEAGGSGSDSRLDGLALKEGVILNLRSLDQEVILSFAVVSNNVVSRVTCNTTRTSLHPSR